MSPGVGQVTKDLCASSRMELDGATGRGEGSRWQPSPTPNRRPHALNKPLSEQVPSVAPKMCSSWTSVRHHQRFWSAIIIPTRIARGTSSGIFLESSQKTMAQQLGPSRTGAPLLLTNTFSQQSNGWSALVTRYKFRLSSTMQGHCCQSTEWVLVCRLHAAPCSQVRSHMCGKKCCFMRHRMRTRRRMGFALAGSVSFVWANTPRWWQSVAPFIGALMDDVYAACRLERASGLALAKSVSHSQGRETALFQTCVFPRLRRIRMWCENPRFICNRSGRLPCGVATTGCPQPQRVTTWSTPWDHCEIGMSCRAEVFRRCHLLHKAFEPYCSQTGCHEESDEWLVAVGLLGGWRTY